MGLYDETFWWEGEARHDAEEHGSTDGFVKIKGQWYEEDTAPDQDELNEYRQEARRLRR